MITDNASLYHDIYTGHAPLCTFFLYLRYSGSSSLLKLIVLTMSSKRKISDLLNAEPDTHSPTRPRPESDNVGNRLPSHSLPYRTNVPSHTTRPTPFQQPAPLLTFSYTPDRTLEFTDSAMRYYVDPPLGAQLRYGYERWIKKPETRGRIDGLLKGLSRAREMSGGGGEVGVVSWRGVMTKYVISVLSFASGYEAKAGLD
jgi:RAT1-interacting protein